MTAQPVEINSGETRMRLLECGTRLFAENGFKGVSVRELCAAAQANIAAIQYHFGGKEGLYQAIFETTLDEDEARFRESMDNINTVIDTAQGDHSQLSVALGMYIKSFFARFPFNEHKRWFSVLVMRELSFPGKGFDLIYARRALPSQQTLARIVAALDNMDENSETTRLKAHVLSGTIMSSVLSRNILFRIMDWNSFTPNVLAQLSQIVTQLVFNSLSLTVPKSVLSSGEKS